MIDTVVITERDGGAVILSGPHEDQRRRHIRPGMLDDLPALLSAAMTTCQGSDPATLVVPRAEITPELVDAAGPGEWTVTGLDRVDHQGQPDRSGWYQVTRRSGRSAGRPRRVHLCILADLAENQESRDRCTLFGPDLDPARIERLLRQYRDLTGAAWYGNPGMSGVGLIRQLAEHPSLAGRGPRPRWVLPAEHEDLAEKLGIPQPVDLSWRRDQPRQGHRWDVRSQYLAAAQAAQLGTDVPEHTGPIPFSQERAGWWLVTVRGIDRLPHVDAAGPPLWDDRCRGADPRWWLTTPMVAYATQLGCLVEVHETLTSPASRRHLRVWGETLRDAVYATTGQGPAELVDSIKGSYTQAIGMMAHPGGRIWRPDWRATIIDLARVLLYRKIARVYGVTGHWPARIHRDSVWYPGELVAAHHQRSAKPFGELLGEGVYIGNFRYEGYEGDGS